VYVFLPLFAWSSLSGLGFADEHALILYVYLSNYKDGADESVLTVSRGQVSGTRHANIGFSTISLHLVYDHDGICI